MTAILKEAEPQARPAQHFPATVGRFDTPADRAVIDGLVRWVEDRYRADLQERPSKHVYIRTLTRPASGSATPYFGPSNRPAARCSRSRSVRTISSVSASA